MRFSHFFIERPIFATVLSVLITIVGLIAGRALPIAEYPEIAPPTVNISANYPGASAAVIAETVAAPDRAGGQRRRQHALHRLAVDGRRARFDQHRVQARHQHRYGAGAGAEPRGGGRAAAAGGRAAPGPHGAQGLARSDDGRAHDLARRHARSAVHLELRHAVREGPARPHRRRRRRAHFRRARLFHARLARSGEGGGARSDGRRGGGGAARGQPAGGGRLDQSAAGQVGWRVHAFGADAGPADGAGAVRKHRHSSRAGTAR